MKTYLTILTVILVYSSNAQTAQPLTCGGIFEPYSWGRSTDSRSEAMGLTATTTKNNINTTHYNPAGLGTLEGIQTSVTYATPYYLSENANFLYTAIAGEINDYIKVQFSRFTYQNNIDYIFLGGLESDVFLTSYTLGIGSEPIKGWYFGGNLKVLESSITKGSSVNTLTGDLGVMKSFELSKTEGHHVLDLGVSVTNFTAQEVTYKTLDNTNQMTHPVNAFGGLSYSYSSVNRKIFDSLNLIGATIQADYVNQINLDERQGYRFGVEFALMELIYLRGGYYYLTTCDFGFPEYNRDNIQSLTYGVGVAVPLALWTKLPLTLNIDFAKLPQPSYTQNTAQEDDFFSFNGHLTWKL